MKITCAWCQTLLGYKCPDCGEPLTIPDQPELRGRYMACRDQAQRAVPYAKHGTTIHFSIERMQTTHTICEDCVAKQTAERAAHYAPRLDQRLLSPEDRANAEAEATPTPAHNPDAENEHEGRR